MLVAAALLTLLPANPELRLSEVLADVEPHAPVLLADRARARALSRAADATGFWDEPFIAAGPDELPLSGEPMPVIRYQLSQRVPFPGKLDGRTTAARTRAEAQAQDVAVTARTLRVAAVQLFLRALYLDEVQHTNDELAQTLHDVKASAEARYITGGTAHHDALLADAQLAILARDQRILERERTVGGVVVMRQGEDAAAVIERVKARLEQMKPSFPNGVRVVTTYDRSTLIEEAVATLQNALIEEVIVVCIVIVLFLLHLRSAVVVAVALPLSILISFIPAKLLGISLNIMSLGGIIHAVGDIVDAVVVFLENAHKKLAERAGPGKDSHKGIPEVERKKIMTDACAELGPSLFASLVIIAVSFLPIFALQAQEGRLFHPLAWTKTFAMLSAALVSITVAPPLVWIFARGRVRLENENPLSRALQALYRPVLAFALRMRALVLALVALLLIISGLAFTRLGSEFMPPLWEGDLLYMPITLPSISVTAATDLMQRQDQALKAIPEVETVFGKAGRFETVTDPSPLSMLEVTIQLKPKSEWRPGLTEEALLKELDDAVVVPGLNRAWTKPVRGRIDMLSTGIRTQVGIKIFGRDLENIEYVGQQIESVLRGVNGTPSVYAERILGGLSLDFEPDRKVIARHGLLVGDVFDVLESAVGGMEVAQVIEGRERYTINVRYPRELRDTPSDVGRILVKTPGGAQVPLEALGRLEMRPGPPMILDEDGMLAGYVYVDLEGRDTGGYVEDAKDVVERTVHLPPGTYVKWTGQYENLARVQERMKVVLPITLLLVFAVLYLALHTLRKTLLVIVSVPLSLTGGILLMWALGYPTSVAVWAGAIALIGVAVETTSIMVVFLDEAWRSAAVGGRLSSRDDVRAATLAGAQVSLRPVLMAVAMNIFGLIPVMVATGVGADVMKRLSSPMFGGLVSLALLTLVVVPVVYTWLGDRPRDG